MTQDTNTHLGPSELRIQAWLEDKSGTTLAGAMKLGFHHHLPECLKEVVSDA